MAKHEFDWFDQFKGGKSRTPAKARAAKRNGKSGGRPPTQTLAQRIFGRALRFPAKNTHWTAKATALEKAVNNLFQGERQELQEYFDVPDLMSPAPYSTVLFRKRDRRPNKRIKFLIQKLRNAFVYHNGMPKK